MLHRIHTIKSYQVFLLLSLVSIILLAVQFKKQSERVFLKEVFVIVTQPISDAFSATVKGVSEFFASWHRSTCLQDENISLKKELAKERFNNQMNSVKLAYFERLKKILGVVTAFSSDAICVEIKARSFQLWDNVIIINGGTNQGFTIGLPVMGVYGVVGKIVLASTHTSEVALLTNEGFSIAGGVEHKTIKGIVHGRGERILSFDYVPISADVEIGDHIVTTGDDGIFPPAWMIGTVVEIGKKGPLFQDIKIKPVMDVGNENYFFVITKRVGGNP